MKVLLVSDFYPPAPGGLEAHVRRLALALHRRGEEVTVLTGGEPPFPDDGFAVHGARVGLDRVPLAYRGRALHPPWPDRTFTAALCDLLDRVEPDVVHAHGWCEFSAVAAAAGRWPVVVTLHDHGLRCPKKNLLRGGVECAHGRGLRCLACPGPEQGTAKRIVLAAALGRTAPRLHAGVARYIAVSRHVARRHLEALPRGADRVEVIPNFLDPPPEPFTEPGGDQVLYIGPSDRHKGLAVLLAAWRRMRAATPARLVVVGAAADEVAGDVDGVEFTGRLSGDATLRRLREAALLVVPSVWPEPCPTVVLEALAAGRPVIGSRIGGIPDLVAHGETGLLVPAGDEAALAGAIASMLADRPALAAMARAAHRAAEAFATDAVVPRIVAVYQDVAALRGVR